MFRGFKPALTLFVFAVGIGLGFSWTRGLIPLSITPANSGSISPEFAVEEDLPPPPGDGQLFARRNRRAETEEPDDPEIFQNQTEPEDDSPAVTSRPRSRPAVEPIEQASRREPEAVSSTDDMTESDDRSAARSSV